MLEKYPKAVKQVPKQFPLPNRQHSRTAAAAALAADEQGKFWELHEKLHENYRVLSEEKIRELATEAGLNLEKLETDMNSEKIQSLIKADIENGRQAGIRGTPTIFVNGKLLQKRSLEGFTEMIEAELNKGKKG